MERSLKVASPLAADTGLVPDRVPPPGLLLIVNVMESVAEVITVSLASRTCTLMAGEMVTPPCVLEGSTLNARWRGGFMLTAEMACFPVPVHDMTTEVDDPDSVLPKP